MARDGDLETIVYTTDARCKIVELYKTLDTLRKRFVLKDGRLAFMYTDTANRPYNGLERALLSSLYKAAGIEEFCLHSSKIYESTKEQEADNDGPFFIGV